MPKITDTARSRVEVGPLAIEPAAYRATLRGTVLPLSRSHLEMLAFIVMNRERVVSREELAAAANLAHYRSVDVALTALRRVLGEGFVRNVRDRGWILEPATFSSED